MSGEHAKALPDEHGEVLATLRQVVERGQRILVVGSPPGTFDDRLQRNARLLFWPSTERSASDALRLIPGEVGAVLVTKMLSHDLSRNVREQAKARELFLPMGMWAPGQIKRLLGEVLASRPVEEEGHTMAPKVTNFVAAQSQAPVAVPQDTQRDLMKLIDDQIAAMELVREGVAQLLAEAATVRQQSEKLRVLRELLGSQ